MKIPNPIKIILIIIVIVIIILVGASLIFKVDLLNEVRTTINTFIKPASAPVDSSAKPLEITVKDGAHETLQPRISLTVTSNQEIETDNPDKFKLTYVRDIGSTKYYAFEILNIGIGSATVPVNFKSKVSGEVKAQSINVLRTAFSLPLGLKDIVDWDNSTYTVDGDNLLVPVNKDHKLVSDYEPADLVRLFDDKNLLVQTNTLMLRSEAAEALSLMVKKLKDETGKPLTIASAYRSYNNQLQQYVSWVRTYGQEDADKVSARPGFSEHQLGTAIDFMSGDSGYDFVNEFDATTAGQWLINNSYKYGYVQSYPDGKDSVTGYSHEAWHYRYIGIDAAKMWKQSGLTLKEFLEKPQS